ncbi:leptin-like [Mugil cephalus]|uniref:leptin-like n=1 Tax=Mugil cephalus TaxID=48193 RepID=UPI001FB7558A|nr:leptin-like [Mugil cephalus]
MEPNSGIHKDTSQEIPAPLCATHGNTTDMNYKLALLFSALHVLSLGTAAPLSEEDMKAKVKFAAKQLLVRLDNVEYPPDVTLSAPFDNLDGLSSVVTVLEGYNGLMSNALDDVALVKSDLSSLTGYLSEWRQGRCSQQLPKPPVTGPLLQLQSQKEFIHTVSIEACLRVKEFLNRLQKNLDQLKTC